MAYGHPGAGAQAQAAAFADPAMGAGCHTAPVAAPARGFGGFSFIVVMFVLLIIVGATII
ncbi:uncharacterized protein (TIGR01732 family) [Natronobacillus azotifigens]|uniref:YjcZ family sporulation protein n=1 Tax=Natronobacillus azotifigens TaxID=472978 RepID=A0A9J6R8R9_9BACI|nr:YjcZ family sporulation protein [Natronobacillus azotifigens]MCZ0701959.1 YjcZ family sporulation protein [Natronobacillus azotifigens]